MWAPLYSMESLDVSVCVRRTKKSLLTLQNFQPNTYLTSSKTSGKFSITWIHLNCVIGIVLDILWVFTKHTYVAKYYIICSLWWRSGVALCFFWVHLSMTNKRTKCLTNYIIGRWKCHERLVKIRKVVKYIQVLRDCWIDKLVDMSTYNRYLTNYCMVQNQFVVCLKLFQQWCPPSDFVIIKFWRLPSNSRGS